MSDRSKANRMDSGIFAWCLYDWAHSAFGTIVTTFVFAPYFIRAVAPTPTEGTVMWGYTMSAAALFVALVSPVLGAIADQSGRCKPWLIAFTTLCTLFSCALYVVTPSTDPLWLALILFACAVVASDLAWVFYNSLLPTLVSRDRLGRISGRAWSFGYFGGMLSVVIALFVFVREGAPLEGLDTGAFEHVRATAILAGIWVSVFALPLYFFTPDRPTRDVPMRKAIVLGLKALADTLREVLNQSNIVWLLASWLFTSNGLATLFAFAGIYAAGTFGMDLDEVMLFAIAVNITAGIGAAAFGPVDDLIGPKKTIFGALFALIVLGVVLVTTDSKTVLWVAGMALGVFIGPAQAASRSFMARLVPKKKEAQMFGLYALSGRVTSFAGPLVLAFITNVFASQRAGMASILVFFALALVAVTQVREPAIKNAPS
ncbi:MAG: MFS transporter [Paracoccaceae bacterium]|nr:MFS transporter [Paracoccaceae bacterium]